MTKDDLKKIETHAKKLMEKTAIQSGIKNFKDNIIEYRDFLNILSTTKVLKKITIASKLPDIDQDRKKLLEKDSKKLYKTFVRD